MEVLVNNKGLELVIIERKGQACVVKFTASGSTRVASYNNIINGKVKDLYHPSRYGIGYDGEFVRKPYWKKAKQLWSNMLKRCYHESDSRGYYKKGTLVDVRWHCFANFLDDLPKLRGFDKWLKGGMELDKDLIAPDANIYSRHTCMFIEQSINRSAGKHGKKLMDGAWVTTSR